jgi:protein-S-isoprenylcysteine O-methyltransferase Ste14
LPGVTRRYWFPKLYADAVARMRVPFGFLLLAAFAWFSRPTVRSLVIGLPIALAGLALRAWAAGHLAKNRDLATSGPYAYTRNPLYIGTLVVAFGFVLAARSWGLGILFALVFFLVYLPVIELEEQHLRTIFPSYAEYADRVPVLWPRVSGGAGQARFQGALYRKNQEYQAAIGMILAAGLLVFRVMWHR